MDNALDKSQFAEYLSLSEELSNTFKGNTHIICRRKLRDINGYYKNEENEIHNFQTFHSLAAKILPKNSVDHGPSTLKTGVLSGQKMYNYVDKAVGVYAAVYDLKNMKVKTYYTAIRLYENDRIDSLLDLEGGYEIYALYQSFMEKKLDWEESIKLATYYLQYDIVTSVKDLPARYIIVDADILLEDSNENVARLYIELNNWGIRNRKNINFYLLKNDKNLVPFIDGNRYDEISVNEILNN